MSNEKNYGLEFIDHTPDEIISEFQRKYSVIVERIQVYNSLLHGHEDLKKTVSEMMAKLEKLPESIAQKSNEIHEIQSSFRKELLVLQSKIFEMNTMMSNHLDTVEGKFETANFNILSICEALNSLRSDHEKSKTAHAALESRISEADGKHASISSRMIEQDSKIAKKAEEYGQCQSNILSLSKRIDQVHLEFNERFNSLLNLEEKFDELERNIHSKVLKLQFTFQDEICRLIPNLEEKNKSQLDSLETHKSECKKMINDNFMDISNSKIKFENINKQLALIEKKIENVNLLLKKYELDK